MQQTPSRSLPEWEFDPMPLKRQLAGSEYELDLSKPAKRFGGGLANINYRVVVDGRTMVLRRAPSGDLPPGAHDMVREHKVLSRLGRVFPAAPLSVLVCEDRAILGAPFQLIEYRAGRAVRGQDLSAIRGDEDLGAVLAPMMADLLANLHSVDVQACRLDDLGKPQGFVQRAVKRWAGRAVETLADGSDAVLAREVADYLTSYFDRWEDRPPVLLHSDFKLDNMILAENSLRPIALIDWDMATRGDPLFDLATLLSYWSEPGDPDCMIRLKQMPTALPGFPTRAEMVQAYEAASGRDLTGLKGMRVLCQVKLAVVFLQLHARWRDGSLGDERYAEFGTLGRDLLEFSRDIAHGRYD